jgi:hypothetical protein
MQSSMIYNLDYDRIMKVVMTSVLVTICVCGLFGKTIVFIMIQIYSTEIYSFR